jgi:TrmH family RNA methyltransferase
VEKIISAQNTLIKETKKLQQKKYRDITKKYLVEGIRMVEEGLQYDILESFFYDETIYKTERGSKLLHKIEDYVKTQNSASCYEVSATILNGLAETETPQGIVAIARQKITELFSLTQDKETGLILIIDGIQDPGNLGTLLRTAWACGTQAVICLPGTVEPFNNKAVRATMGSIFQVPLIINESWTNIYNWCNKHEYKLVAGDINGETDYSQVLYPPKVALIIGNEGQGLLSVSSDQVDYKVKIPLLNGVESLNASVAGGILLYEIIKRKAPKSCHYG